MKLATFVCCCACRPQVDLTIWRITGFTAYNQLLQCKQISSPYHTTRRLPSGPHHGQRLPPHSRRVLSLAHESTMVSWAPRNSCLFWTTGPLRLEIQEHGPMKNRSRCLFHKPGRGIHHAMNETKTKNQWGRDQCWQSKLIFLIKFFSE